MPSLDYLQISALRSAYYAAVERERQIGISQAGEMRAQEAHESNMSTADLNRATLELNRMITELMLPLTLDGQRASNAATVFVPTTAFMPCVPVYTPQALSPHLSATLTK